MQHQCGICGRVRSYHYLTVFPRDCHTAARFNSVVCSSTSSKAFTSVLLVGLCTVIIHLVRLVCENKRVTNFSKLYYKTDPTFIIVGTGLFLEIAWQAQ